jgi:hypothetical protein
MEPLGHGGSARGRAENAVLAGGEPLVRLGFVVRGILYFVTGGFALALALGPHGAAMAPTGAIGVIGHQQLGKPMLVVVAIGLAGYMLWGLVRAVFDPLQRGKTLKGIASRLGYGMSALGHGALLVATLRYLAGHEPQHAASKGWIHFLVAQPYGRWMLLVVGITWVLGAGISQVIAGWRGTAKRDLKLERMSRTEQAWLLPLGRFGMVVRGLVFTIVGLFLVATALRQNPQDLQGMDGALLRILSEPLGRWLLAFAALGIMAFGMFSMMCARWMRIRPEADTSPSHSSSPANRGSS